MDYNLSEQQLEAVMSTEGPLLILAGAGSGKTRTVTYRIAHILSQGLAKPYQILALTFTNKAANEMKERIASFGINETQDIWMGTFHSICVRILRSHADKIGLHSNFTIFDEDDVLALLKTIAKSLGEKLANKDIAMLRRMISQKKSDIDISEASLESFQEASKTSFEDFFELYCDELKKNNAVDFDDLIRLPVDLFKANDDVLKIYQNRFRYIFVDEYQDTSQIQYELVFLLARERLNICVCGDEDQSIYSWRGADIRNILEFQKDFANAKLIKLEENYRSTKAILQAANNLIANNTQRIGKTLYTNKDQGQDIHIEQANDDRSEAAFIANTIIGLLGKQKAKLSDIAVLFRTNALSRQVEAALMRYSIPYLFIAGTRFYERKEVKDILAYLRLSVNPDDSVAFKRAVQTPRRGLGDAALDKIAEFASFKGYSLLDAAINAQSIATLSKKQQDKLGEFGQLIAKISKAQSASWAVTVAIEESGYQSMLKNENTEDAFERLRNLEELIAAASDFGDSGISSSVAEFLQTASLVSPTDFMDYGLGSVNMMTIHASKGLEFKYVFLIGLEEGLFPNSWSHIEEERRLCYVAITRAQEQLYLSWVKSRYSRRSNSYAEAEPSRFLTEITGEQPQPEINAIVEGDTVAHPKFGRGVVVAVNDSDAGLLLTVAYVGRGLVKLADEAVELVKGEDSPLCN
ncbi:MAG: UvrD-helicase domain-containing protein [Eubacteriaceae bacterium]|nr:UvrD-helicase domain-containing protein [Eubacteriaceae bacterium]